MLESYINVVSKSFHIWAIKNPFWEAILAWLALLFIVLAILNIIFAFLYPIPKSKK